MKETAGIGEGPLNVRVECYAGYRGEETPRRFYLRSRRVEVQEVVDRWLAPDHRYFKIRGDDGDLYILRHGVHEGEWQLTFFAKTSPPGAPSPDDSSERSQLH